MNMPDDDYCKLPGLYHLWDLQFLLCPDEEYRILYAEMTEDRTPLFAVYRRVPPQPGRLQ